MKTEEIMVPPNSDFLSQDELTAKFNEAQRAFLEEQEYMDYSWSMDELTFEVESEQQKRVSSFVPIGTWSPHTENFRWAFSIPELPQSARALNARHFATIKNNPNLPKVATQSEFSIAHVDLDDLLAVVHHEIGSWVVFKEKNMEPWLFMAVLSPSSSAATH